MAEGRGGRGRLLAWLGAALALLVLVLWLGVAPRVVATSLASDLRRPVERTPGAAGLGFETLDFESADGVPLRAW